MVGQGKFHQLVTVCKDFRSDIDFAHGAFDAFREFDAEYVFPFRFVDQSEPFGCLRHGGSLDKQGEDGDKEYDVEYQPRMLNPGNQRISGEDDRDGSAKAYPGDI